MAPSKRNRRVVGQPAGLLGTTEVAASAAASAAAAAAAATTLASASGSSIERDIVNNAELRANAQSILSIIHAARPMNTHQVYQPKQKEFQVRDYLALL